MNVCRDRCSPTASAVIRTMAGEKCPLPRRSRATVPKPALRRQSERGERVSASSARDRLARDGGGGSNPGPRRGGRQFGEPADLGRITGRGGHALQLCSSRSRPFRFFVSRADRVEATEAEIAVALASHQGEERHVATVRGLLAKARVSEDALGCGPQLPSDEATARRLLPLAGYHGRSTTTAQASTQRCSPPAPRWVGRLTGTWSWITRARSQSAVPCRQPPVDLDGASRH